MKNFVARLWLKIWGLKFTPPPEPLPDKFVVIAAPHTTNWDLPLALAMARLAGIHVEWLGKDSLFKPPIGWLMRRIGGVPVDRSTNRGMVEEMAAQFETRDSLHLLIAAEGTRSQGDYWKSGFYRIALAAGVPIATGYCDKPGKRCGFGPLLYPTGDVSADMDTLREIYAPYQGLKPANRGRLRLREEDAALGDGSDADAGDDSGGGSGRGALGEAGGTAN